MPRKTNGGKRRTKRGGYYGFTGDLGTPGAANWTRGSEMGDWTLSNRGGNSMYGAGRRRKHKGKKRTQRRKMRGGYSYGQAVAGFTGSGAERGLGGFTDVSAPGGKSALGSFANHGAQPGSGHGSFITAGSK